VRRRPGAIALVALLALGCAACRDRSGTGARASATTVSSETAQSPTTAVANTGPVTEADVADGDDVLRRLDVELDRLDADMAAGEGDTQPVPLEQSKSAATGAITRRLLALRGLSTVIDMVSRLSQADRTALTDQIQAQVDGLTTLNAKIQGTADPANLRADASRIVTDYHVYALTIPKVRGILVADLELNAVERFTKLADRFTGAVNQARAKGKDTTTAVADLASLRTGLAAVAATVTPLPGALLTLQPSGFPATQAVLEQARVTLRTGRVGLDDAARLARQVIADLK